MEAPIQVQSVSLREYHNIWQYKKYHNDEKYREKILTRMKNYNSRPDIKKRVMTRNADPEYKEKIKKYQAEYNARPDVQIKKKQYSRSQYLKRKEKESLVDLRVSITDVSITESETCSESLTEIEII